MDSTFIKIIKEYERVIYKVCYMYASDELPVADLYQEIVINLWRGFPKFRNESQISTWIYKIAINTCITQFRKSSRKPKSTISAELLSETLLAPGDFSSELKELYNLINQLSVLEKTIVLLYFDEKSYAEIAEITGLSQTNVGVKLNRIKEKLKKMSNQ